MFSVDTSNFINYLKNFPGQIQESKSIFENASINFQTDKIKNIVFSGMGGSAIAGDLLHNYAFDKMPVPYQVVRGYQIPAYCDGSTLAIISSYSGNTEETLEAARQLNEKGAQIIAITSGGELLERAKKNNWSSVVVPAGNPPRQAFGYSFFCLLRLMMKLGFVDVEEAELENIYSMMQTIVKRNDYKTATGKILSQDIARQIQGKIPIIYSTAPYLRNLGTRWKNQFQENAKSMAFTGVIPEMNHNEIVGWEQDHECLDKFIVIMLEDKEINPRNRLRQELTTNIIKDRGVEVLEIYSEGRTRLEHLVSLVALGDWVSYYLAIYYKKDPMSILNIDYLKGELQKNK